MYKYILFLKNKRWMEGWVEGAVLASVLSHTEYHMNWIKHALVSEEFLFTVI